MDNSTSKWRSASVIISFLVGLSLLAIPFARPDNVPVFFLFLGRLHPLVLHFPIVLIMLALIVEIGRRRFLPDIGDTIIQIILITASVSAVIAIVAGFFLFASGQYSGIIIERHLWAGIITGSGVFLSLTAFLIYRKTGRFYAVYLFLVIACNLSLIYTSHLGGSVTHGEDYLSEHLNLMMADTDNDEEKEVGQLLVYADMLLPVFESKCASCHNSQRAKGAFVMTGLIDLFKSGDSGHPGIVRGSVVSSEISKRIGLPETDDDHMPPEGKTPMTSDEIAVLNYWIAKGASDTMKVVSGIKQDTIRLAMERLIPELTRYKIKSAIARLKAETIRTELADLSSKLHLAFKRDSLSEGNLFTASMILPPVTITSGDFQDLHPYLENFSRVSFTSAGLQDDALYYISQMKNVKTLYLQKNALNGSGLVYLKDLDQLEVLNLSFNRIDDKSVLDLLLIPNLKTVYLYRTNTSPQVIEALVRNRPGLNVMLEEGPYL